MSNTNASLARRYAKALFAFAKKKKAEDAVAEDLAALREAAITSNAALKLLSSPVVKAEEKQDLFQKLLKKIKAHKITEDAIALLIQNKRLNILPEVAEAYDIILKKERDIINVEITAAAELSGKQEKEIADILSKYLGKKVATALAIDPSLLGGMVIKMESKMLDFSIAGKLNRLRVGSKDALTSL